MSNFREKAEEIKATAASERGNFTPTGAPMKVYNWWLKNTFFSKKAREIREGKRRENFCHFWRVVVIWAGLNFVGRMIQRALESTVGLSLLVILAIFLVVTSGFTFPQVGLAFLGGAGILLALAYLLAGALTGSRVGYGFDYRDTPASFLPSLSFSAKWGPLFFVTHYPAIVINRLARNDTFKSVLGGIIIFLMSIVAVVAVVVLTYLIVQDFGWLGTLALLAGIVGLALVLILVITGVSMLGDYLIGKRKERQTQKALDRANAPIVVENVEPREPGKISKFFTGLADFVILFAQVVRVKKWKICPLVEVETNK